jgi:hypothetical protein
MFRLLEYEINLALYKTLLNYITLFRSHLEDGSITAAETCRYYK